MAAAAAPAAAAAAAAAPVQSSSDVFPMSVLPLGKVDTKKYLSVTTFKDKVYFHVRVFLSSYKNPGMLKPMQSGVALSAEQWNRLVAATDAIDSQIRALQQTRQDGDVPTRQDDSPISLGQDTEYYVVVSIWNGDVKVHIRAYKTYSTKLYPTNKGIALTVDEWTTLTRQSHIYLSTRMNPQDTAQCPDNKHTPMLVLDDPPRKVIVKQEQPSTPTKRRCVITRDGNPLDWAPKKQKIDNETYSDVDDFLARFAADLAGETPDRPTSDIESLQEKVNNCEGCQFECANQEAHYDGCLKDIVNNMY
jgi:hypothetical protein